MAKIEKALYSVVCYNANHVHMMIAFSTVSSTINTLVGNGKRFMAYELVKKLKEKGCDSLLEDMSTWVNKSEKLQNKRHQVFEPSFDRKECFSISFMKQKADYIHKHPCKAGVVNLPEKYKHSSARYYYTGTQGEYPVITYMELQDIDLT